MNKCFDLVSCRELYNISCARQMLRSIVEPCKIPPPPTPSRRHITSLTVKICTVVVARIHHTPSSSTYEVSVRARASLSSSAQISSHLVFFFFFSFCSFCQHSHFAPSTWPSSMLAFPLRCENAYIHHRLAHTLRRNTLSHTHGRTHTRMRISCAHTRINDTNVKLNYHLN